MERTYKIELDPNNKQRSAFNRHAGAARFAFNWGLAYWITAYKLACEQAGPDGKVSRVCSAITLHKVINVLKKTPAYSWMYGVSKWCIQSALQDVEVAFKGFFFQGKGYPNFKSKHRCKKSFRVRDVKHVTDTHVQLPKIGKVRFKEHGYIPAGSKVQFATISERAGHWFISIVVREPNPIIPVNESTEVLGIDLGIKDLATCSDGTVYENPRALNSLLRQIKNLSKKLARQVKGSKRRARTQKRLAMLYYRVSCIRNDAIHKMTTEIVRTKRPNTVNIENLNVRGMVKNHSLARHVSDAAFGEIRRQLTYKCARYGVGLTIVDRWYPSTKRCSSCGNVKSEMGLGEREYVCEACGTVLDRDLNAALNLRDWTAASSAGYGRGEKVRLGSSSKRVSTKRQPDNNAACSVV